MAKSKNPIPVPKLARMGSPAEINFWILKKMPYEVYISPRKISVRAVKTQTDFLTNFCT